MFGVEVRGWKGYVMVGVVVVVAIVIGAALQARKPFVQSVPVVGNFLAGQ
jgi:hypothetical protein